MAFEKFYEAKFTKKLSRKPYEFFALQFVSYNKSHNF